MTIVSWNLNHRAARRPIPTWISEAIAAQAPDFVSPIMQYLSLASRASESA